MKVGKMSFFSGKYKYSVDEKNRINFKKFLNRVENDDKKSGIFHLLKQTVSVIGSDKTYPVFYIFTEKTWKEFYSALEESREPEELSAFNTQFCDEANLDNMERITFPKDFLNYIQSSKNLFLQGFGDKLQVWSLENFEEYGKKLSESAPMKDFYNILSKKKKQ